MSEIDLKELDDDLLYRSLGQNIRDLRLRRVPRMTQEQLAVLLDVERTSITNIESGTQRAPLGFLYRVALIFEVPLSEILPSPQDVNTRREPHNSESEMELPSKRMIGVMGGLGGREVKPRRARR